MTRISIISLFVIVILLPGLAGAVSEKDFEVQTTENIINLCTASPDDPLYHQAINFCHGFMVGAYRYYEAAGSGPGGLKLVCLPDPRPSRNDTIDMFIDWAKAHPQHWGEPPVESEFRFLTKRPSKRPTIKPTIKATRPARRANDRSQKTDDRKQVTEGRSPKTDDEGRKEVERVRSCEVV